MIAAAAIVGFVDVPAHRQAVVGTPRHRGWQAAIIETRPTNLRTSATVACAWLCSI
jgi:hypothetical protein